MAAQEGKRRSQAESPGGKPAETHEQRLMTIMEDVRRHGATDVSGMTREQYLDHLLKK